MRRMRSGDETMHSVYVEWIKQASNFCKQGAECFSSLFVIVSMEYGLWQASFRLEKSTDRSRLV